MSEYTEIARECGAEDSILCAGYLLLDNASVDAFATAIRRKTLEEAHAKLQEYGLGHATGFYTLERLKAMAQEGVTK